MAGNQQWKRLICIMCAYLFCGFSVVLATVPDKISFQGRLTDDLGEPVPDGAYSMQFFLFDALTGGNQLWNPNNGESQEVTVTSGIFNVQLGAVQPLDSSIFEGGAAWLEIAIYNVNTTSWETLSPRQLITTTAYSLKAGDADTLGGATSSEFAPDFHDHQGEDITGGTIGASFIDDVIARDTELTWGNIDGIPADISDGDDVGITTETDPTVAASLKDGVSWTELTGIPAGFADNVDDVGLTGEIDPQVGINTTNYVPRWNGSALASGTIFDNGNIGIGTSTPIDKLEVDGGSITIDGSTGVAALRLRQDDTMMWTLFTAPWEGDNDFRIRNEGGTGDVLAIDRETGNIGIGTNTPESALNILGGAWDLFNTEGDFKIGGPTNRLKIGIARGGLGAGTAGILAQGVVNTLKLGSGDNYVITIKNDSVGIGNTNPNEKLDVTGDIQITGNYKFSSPKTDYLNVPPCAFTKNEIHDAVWAGTNYKYISYGSSDRCFVEAPVFLPEGATITSVTLHYIDSHETEDVFIEYIMKRRLESSSVSIYMASANTISTGHSTSIQKITDDTINYPNISNDYFYWITVEWDPTNITFSPSLSFWGVRITYTLTHVAS